ncbi:MAG TPA: hypothetical protein VIJ29_00180 [Candidatus Paceibacterota bacterium]
MNIKEIEELFKKSRAEVRQLFGVFEERMDDKFKLVTERFDTIDKTMDKHTEMFKDINEKLDTKADVKEVDELERRVIKLERKEPRPSRSG